MSDQPLHVRLALLVHEADVGRIPLSRGDRALIEEAAAELKRPSLPSDIEGLVEELERGLDGMPAGVRRDCSDDSDDPRLLYWTGAVAAIFGGDYAEQLCRWFALCSPNNIRKLIAALRARQAPASLAKPETTPCERCQGNGEIVTDWERYRHPRDGDAGDEAVTDCPACDGTGEITLSDEPRQAPELGGYIVANGKGTHWRCWRDGVSTWTDNKEEATRYARREDAEAVHSDDEFAWLIQPYEPRRAPEGVVVVTDAMIEAGASELASIDNRKHVFDGDFERAEGVLRAALSAMPSGEVKVRKLEWELTASTSYTASAIGLRYYLYGGEDGGWRAYTEGYQPAVFGTFATIAEGMNACQADYETRILSALEGVAGEAGCWQPIDTAPKDGTTFWGYAPQDGEVGIAFWDGDWDEYVFERKSRDLSEKGYYRGYPPAVWHELPKLPGQPS